MSERRYVDVEEIMERIRDNLQRGRAPADGGTAESRDDSTQHGQATADLDFLTSGYDVRQFDLVSHRRVFGKVVIGLKRAIRQLLTPILDRQVACNAAVVRVIADTRDWIAALERRRGEAAEAIEARINHLARKLNGHDVQITSVEVAVSRFAPQVARVDARVAGVQAQVDGVAAQAARRLDVMESRLDVVDRQIVILAEGIRARDDRLTAVEEVSVRTREDILRQDAALAEATAGQERQLREATALLRTLYARARPADATFVPPGHFYSPLVDVTAVAADRARIWPDNPAMSGIDFNDAGHQQLLTGAFPRFLPLYDYPEQLPDGPELADFYTRNDQFSWLDARALFVLMHAWRPRRILEVGSGYSSLLMADVNRRWFGGDIDITCIEPYPRPFLKNRIRGLSRLIEDKAQNVAIDTFAALEAGDVLFIDSSHVTKTGSDVNRLYFDVLPALPPGVRIHIHDIFLPHEYPQQWVIDQNRSWNEQYLVRALLMYSRGFGVEFGCAYAFHAFPDLVIKALAHPNGRAYGGASLWLTKLI